MCTTTAKRWYAASWPSAPSAMLHSLSSLGNTTRCESFLYRPSCSMYLNRLRCRASTGGELLTSMRFCASCRPPHASQWNFSDAPSVSTLLKFRRHALTLLFCSMSRLRSKNASSRDVTVSHHRHLVWFVSFPWNMLCTHVVTGSPAGGTRSPGRCSRSSMSHTSLRRKLRNSWASWCMKLRNSSLSFFSRAMNLLGATTPVFFFCVAI
mmetsp:Transcript_23267/g.79175  ORF Transcript_23267/g.79175 Transcript_23267/m.79175 type:complete len:209 (-) Transcript_23267:51-677(-)